MDNPRSTRTRASNKALVAYPAAAIATAVLIIASFQVDALFLLLPFTTLIAILLLFCGTGLLIAALVMRHGRLAFSALSGLVLISAPCYMLQTIETEFERFSFWLARPSFERMVERQRSQEPRDEPMRIVVYRKWTAFSATPAFDCIIYDETDRALADPSSMQGLWPYAGSNAGVISIDGHKPVRPIQGHFYRIYLTH